MLSFIAVGIVLLVGAYAYQRVRAAGAQRVNVGAVLAAFVAVGLAAHVETSEFRYTRTLAAPARAPVTFEPDAAMYGHASEGFPDLRVVDADGTQVPWRTEPLPAAVPPRAVAARRPRELDGVVSVVLDRGAAPEVIDRVELDIPGSRIRR